LEDQAFVRNKQKLFPSPPERAILKWEENAIVTHMRPRDKMTMQSRRWEGRSAKQSLSEIGSRLSSFHMGAELDRVTTDASQFTSFLFLFIYFDKSYSFFLCGIKAGAVTFFRESPFDPYGPASPICFNMTNILN